MQWGVFEKTIWVQSQETGQRKTCFKWKEVAPNFFRIQNLIFQLGHGKVCLYKLSILLSSGSPLCHYNL